MKEMKENKPERETESKNKERKTTENKEVINYRRGKNEGKTIT